MADARGPTPRNTPEAKNFKDEPDAKLPEILAYSVGSLTNDLNGTFFFVMMPVLVIGFELNPLLVGFMLALKTPLDGIVDPLIAWASDNMRGRWGRRKPFLLVGGITMPLIFLLTWFLLPEGPTLRSNDAPAVTEATGPDEELEPPANADGESLDEREVPTGDVPSDETSIEEVTEEQAPAEGEVDGEEKKLSFFENLSRSWHAMLESGPYSQTVFWTILIGMMFMTVAQSLYSTVYYALGIEICPSYDGRTRVVAWRAAVQKSGQLLKQWVQPFVFATIFATALHGMRAWALLITAISLPAMFWMLLKTRERSVLVYQATEHTTQKRMGLLKGCWMIVTNWRIMRLFIIRKIIGASNSIVGQLGIFLNIYFVFGGEVAEGSTWGAWVGTFGWIIGFAMIPITRWLCLKHEKHHIMAFSVWWLIGGAILKWFVFVPGEPQWQLLLPPFYAIGFTAFYMLLPTMSADLTDDDELRTGERREAMIGAVLSLVDKIMDTFQQILTGVIIALSGFVVARGADQDPGVFFNMRFLLSAFPAAGMLLAFVLLYKYPLTSTRIEQIKAELAARRAAAAKSSSEP